MRFEIKSSPLPGNSIMTLYEATIDDKVVAKQISAFGRADIEEILRRNGYSRQSAAVLEQLGMPA